MATTQEVTTSKPTVRERREAMGISQRDFALMADVSRQTLIQVERDLERGVDPMDIKSGINSRRKVVAALGKEEERRRDLIGQLLDEGKKNVARVVQDTQRKRAAGEMSETAATIAYGRAMTDYADALADLDPAADKVAREYLEEIVAAVQRAQRKKAEEN